MAFYASFGTVMVLLAITAPVSLLFGFFGAMAARSHILPLKLDRQGVFLDGARNSRHRLFPVRTHCTRSGAGMAQPQGPLSGLDGTNPARQRLRGVRCSKNPSVEFATVDSRDIRISFLAVFAFAIVFGAFAANVLYGAMRAVPKPQLETAAAYGMTRRQTFWRVLVPQMWVLRPARSFQPLANPCEGHTPLLFLLGVEDIVYWARELGGMKTQAFSYPHP